MLARAAREAASTGEDGSTLFELEDEDEAEELAYPASQSQDALQGLNHRLKKQQQSRKYADDSEEDEDFDAEDPDLVADEDEQEEFEMRSSSQQVRTSKTPKSRTPKPSKQAKAPKKPSNSFDFDDDDDSDDERSQLSQLEVAKKGKDTPTRTRKHVLDHAVQKRTISARNSATHESESETDTVNSKPFQPRPSVYRRGKPRRKR